MSHQNIPVPLNRYYGIHGFVTLFVCIFGSIANSLNIAVLTRRDMRSPTNAILTGLAIADLLVMIDYIPIAINEYLYLQFDGTRESQRSYAWAIMQYFHAFFSQTAHTISIFLTVTLAVWRYIAIAHPQKNRAWCNMRNTIGAITSSYVICPLLCSMVFLMIRIMPMQEMHNSKGVRISDNETLPEGTRNVTVYLVVFTDLVAQHKWVWTMNMFIFGAIIKIIPCIALTVLSLRLIGALLEAKRRRKQLMMGTSNGMRPIISKEIKNGQEKKAKSRFLDKERQTDRTTRMLLAVLLLFLITEFPQGILGLLSVSSERFYLRCYLRLGEFGCPCLTFIAVKVIEGNYLPNPNCYIFHSQPR